LLKLNTQEIEVMIDEFIKETRQLDIGIKSYKPLNIHTENQKAQNIGIQLNYYKEIVLGSETGLQLGGINNKSLSLVYPIKKANHFTISDEIQIIGPEVDEIRTSQISFSLFILLVIKNLNDEIYDELRNLTFISDSIEGFTIRSIPRRFWCRISQAAMKKGFSFRFLGKAICHLYKRKFGTKLDTIKILMISSNSILIDRWLEYTEKMRNDLNKRWRAKVDTWKKRIDCDYEWTCKICPYFASCQSLQELLERRKNLEL